MSRRTLAIVLLTTITVLGACGGPEVQVTEKPIQILEDRPGRGRAASAGDIVTIDYRAELPDGSEVMSATEYEFELGRGVVIMGIDEAVTGMRVGGRREVIFPPHKHWGREGHGDGAIPRNVNLTFHIALRDVD